MRRALFVVTTVVTTVLLSACEAPSGAKIALDPEAGFASVARLAGSAAKGKALELADPACTSTGACVCKGVIDEKVRAELGRTTEQLAKGVTCLASDFDGNGTVDFAIPVGEGVAVVLMNGAAGVERQLSLDVGGDLSLAGEGRKTLQAQVDGIERTWTWAGEGFAYVEKPKG